VGTHAVVTAWGKTRRLPDLRALHYPIRGFERLETKVANAGAFFDVNMHLMSRPRWRRRPLWGWHWRRWMKLKQEGRLLEEYERQFVSPERAAELLRDGVCTLDETIATWVKQRRLDRTIDEA
jgi:hypothetical protein